MRERLDPARRTLQEVRGRHQDARAAGEERAQHAADEPHVVIERQPVHRVLAREQRKAARNHLQVREQVAMRDHDAARLACRARRVLEKRERVAVDRRPLPQAGIAVDAFGVDPRERRERRRLGQRVLRLPADHRCGQDGGGLRVVRDHLQARERAIEPRRVRRIGRHRYDAGVEAAEERGEKLEPLRIEQQRSLAREAGLPQRHGDDARAAIEVGVRIEIDGAVDLAVPEEPEERPLAPLGRARGRHVGDSRDRRGTSRRNTGRRHAAGFVKS
jgi:hypothetical protein